MGIAERKERQKAELREQILEAARRIVLEHGFAELSMRKIAEAIEYSPATIYLYFENRDEIALQLVREGFEVLLSFMADALAIEDPYERIFAIGRRYVDFGEAHPETYRLIFMEDPKFTNHVMGRDKLDDPNEPGGRAFHVVMDTVAQLVERKIFRPVDPETIANILWASVHGIVSLQISCPELRFEDLEGHVDLMMSALVRGLSA